MQVRVLPAKCCLQDLMYLAQGQGAPEFEPTPNLRLAADQVHANLQDRVLSHPGPGFKVAIPPIFAGLTGLLLRQGSSPLAGPIN